MATGLVTTNGIPKPVEMPRSEAIERALINGDLSGLSPRERWDYYVMRCDAAGLDPRSQPFQYINMPARGNSPAKLVLYATKSTTDQLIANHRLTVKVVRRGFDKDTSCYIAEAQVSFPGGQSVEDIGAVFIGENMAGEPLANAVMKCVTKAKRRTVLSACGLGMLDESEIETIPGATRINSDGHPLTIDSPIGSRPAIVHDHVNEPRSEEVSELKAFVRAEIQAIHDHWRNVLLIEGKGDLFKPLANEFQVANHLVSAWLQDGTLAEADILKPDGKRDRLKIGAALQVAWSQDSAEVKADIREYLTAKLNEAAKAAGVELVASDDEPPNVNAED